jgi:hypothetical protein
MLAELQVQHLREALWKRERLSIKAAVIVASGIALVAALVRIFT